MVTEESRLADIQTSLAVLATNSTSQSSQIDEIKRTFEKHIEHEDKIASKLFNKVDALEDQVAQAEGSIKGARWAFGAVLSVLASIATFIGLN